MSDAPAPIKVFCSYAHEDEVRPEVACVEWSTNSRSSIQDYLQFLWGSILWGEITEYPQPIELEGPRNRINSQSASPQWMEDPMNLEIYMLKNGSMLTSFVDIR